MFISSVKLQTKQQSLLLAGIALALTAAAILIITLPAAARQGAGNGSNASIFLTAECLNGAWVNHANVLSNTNSLGPVDIYATLNATQVIKIQDNLSLSTTDRYFFDSSPQPTTNEERMYVTTHSGLPLGDVEPVFNEPIATSNRVRTPC